MSAVRDVSSDTKADGERVWRQVARDFSRVSARESPACDSGRVCGRSRGMQGKFWEMHALLFEHQNEWKTQFDARPIFEGYAKQIGLDVERFKRDVDSDRVEQRIFLDVRRARSMGVGSTPTVFINNKEIPFQLLPADSLRVLIQDELRAAGTQK